MLRNHSFNPSEPMPVSWRHEGVYFDRAQDFVQLKRARSDLEYLEMFLCPETTECVTADVPRI